MARLQTNQISATPAVYVHSEYATYDIGAIPRQTPSFSWQRTPAGYLCTR